MRRGFQLELSTPPRHLVRCCRTGEDKLELPSVRECGWKLRRAALAVHIKDVYYSWPRSSSL